MSNDPMMKTGLPIKPETLERMETIFWAGLDQGLPVQKRLQAVVQFHDYIQKRQSLEDRVELASRVLFPENWALYDELLEKNGAVTDTRLLGAILASKKVARLVLEAGFPEAFKQEQEDAEEDPS